MTGADVLKMIKDNEVRFVDFRFTDTQGKEQHVSVPASARRCQASSKTARCSTALDRRLEGIQESDMILMPDPSTAMMDPFMEEPTLILRCDVVEPSTMQGYERCPRSLAKRAEAYLKSTGVADTAFFGPGGRVLHPRRRALGRRHERQFRQDRLRRSLLEHRERCTRAATSVTVRGIKGGYFPVPPVDSQQDIRSAMCLAMEDMGLKIETHHHEVATAGQNEIGMLFNTLVKKADELQIYKYCVHNVAHNYGKTATFMPKPIVGDNGSGMHVHQSLGKDGKNLFSGNEYGGLSQTAIYYIGGIIKHARALNAITNSLTNSYKRLVPGFEAPVMLAYSARNRSASIRIPYVPNPKARRIEVRFPDAGSNPYLAFAAMMMAGLDGIQNKIHPGEAMDKDLYDLPPEESKKIPTVCHSLDMALEALDKDRDFLTKGGVFTNDLLDAYIALKMQEVTRLRMTTHPIEFDMYYSV